MDSSVVGLVGAVIGALLGGGAKIFQDHLTNRLESRTAARILWVAMTDMKLDVSLMLETGQSSHLDDLWESTLTDWNDRQVALGRVLSRNSFLELALLFQGAKTIADTLKKRPNEPLSTFDQARTNLGAMQPMLDEALVMLEAAGMSIADRTRAEEDAERVPPSPPRDPSDGAVIGC